MKARKPDTREIIARDYAAQALRASPTTELLTRYHLRVLDIVEFDGIRHCLYRGGPDHDYAYYWLRTDAKPDRDAIICTLACLAGHRIVYTYAGGKRYTHVKVVRYPKPEELKKAFRDCDIWIAASPLNLVLKSQDIIKVERLTPLRTGAAVQLTTAIGESNILQVVS